MKILIFFLVCRFVQKDFAACACEMTLSIPVIVLGSIGICICLSAPEILVFLIMAIVTVIIVVAKFIILVPYKMCKGEKFMDSLKDIYSEELKDMKERIRKNKEKREERQPILPTTTLSLSSEVQMYKFVDGSGRECFISLEEMEMMGENRPQGEIVTKRVRDGYGSINK